MIDRQPPQNAEAERAVLSSIFLLPRVLDEIPWLQVGDFGDPSYGTLYAVLRDLHDAGKPCDDLNLVTSAMTKAKALDWFGGVTELARILQEQATAAHAGYYATEVRRCATLRKLIEAGTDMVTDAYSPDADPAEQLARAEQAIYGIQDTRSAAKTAPVKHILADAMERLDARMRGEELANGVSTGFPELDSMLGGLRDGELIVLAARPSMGKTALAMNIAEHVTLDLGEPVLFCSLEMSGIELGDRLLSSVARVNGHRMRNGTISHEDRQRIVERSGAIADAPLHVDDTPNLRVSEIASAARRVGRKGGLRMVVVDYLQLIEPDNSRDNRQEQVARISRRLKGMAKELGVPVLCLAQLNRQAGEGGEPKLSHLRESGAIEQDADVVMFVHRPGYYQTGEASNDTEAKILVRKQRNGPTGDVELVWRKDFTRFENKAAADMDNYQPAFAEYNNEPEQRGWFG